MRAIPVSEIKKYPEQVLDCLMCRREFGIMIQMTRVVGYYSRVQNWNRSKLAELKDRQAGQYSAPGEARGNEARTLEKVA
jgi:hypothetical protein